MESEQVMTGRKITLAERMLAPASAETVQPGDTVTYLGHQARVIHVFTTTANIYFAEPVHGQSRQQDVYLYALRPVQP